MAGLGGGQVAGYVLAWSGKQPVLPAQSALLASGHHLSRLAL